MSSDLSESQRAVYETLARRTDVDSLHDLLVRYGTSVLDRGIPYILVAVRNRLASRRRGPDGRQVPIDDLIESGQPTSSWDPAQMVTTNETLRLVAEALAAMEPADAFVLWASANDASDAQVISDWNRLGFVGELTPTSLRKRRQRAREQLRRLTEQ